MTQMQEHDITSYTWLVKVVTLPVCTRRCIEKSDLDRSTMFVQAVQVFDTFELIWYMMGLLIFE